MNTIQKAQTVSPRVDESDMNKIQNTLNNKISKKNIQPVTCFFVFLNTAVSIS